MNSQIVKSAVGTRNLVCLVSGIALLTAGCASQKKAQLLETRPLVPTPYTEPATAPVAPPVEPVMPEMVTPEKGTAVAPAVKAAAAKPAKVASKIVEYKIVKGDSLYKIAWEHGVSVDELASFNKMKKDSSLKAGASLHIPPGGKFVPLAKRPLPKAGAPKAEKAEKGDKAAKSEKSEKGGKTVAHKDGADKGKKGHDEGEAPKKAKTYEPLPADGKYKVQKNDNPWIIAHRFGLRSADIIAANKLKEGASLQIGQELILPKPAEGGAATPAKATETATPAAETPAAPATPDAAAATTAPGGAAPAVAAPPSAAPAVATPPAPGAAVAAPGAPAAAPAAANTIEHTVLEGEKLQSIADTYEIKVDSILKVNPTVKSDADLKPNMTILVPLK